MVASTYPRWRGDPEPGFVHELSKRLTGQFEVVVLAPHARGASSCEVLDGVRIVRYRYAPVSLQTLVNEGGIMANLRRSPWKWLLVPGFLLAQALGLFRLLRSWRPDVVHAHWLVPQGVLVASALSLFPRAPRFVVTSHGADLFALKGVIFDRLRSSVVGRAAAVTVVSSAMRDALLTRHAKRPQLHVMPMGVDLSTRFVVSNDHVREASQLLFVGRLVEKKGLARLIKAMPLILERMPDARLTVVGYGPEEARIRALVSNLNLGRHVVFAGPLPQASLPALYQKASVFVAPFIEAEGGDQEGLGLVVVEALACGCPVVVGDVAAVRDVLPRTGNCGEVISPGDSRALADAVCRVVATAKQGGPAGDRRRAASVSGFAWDQRAASYGRLLMQAAART